MAETMPIPFVTGDAAEAALMQEVIAKLTEGHLRVDPKLGLDLESYYQDDELGQNVLKEKYLAPGEKGPADLWRRLARAIAGMEEHPEVWEERFYSILYDFRFVPGGRIMHGAGRDDIKTTLNNCYVVGIKEDSIDAIYQALVDEALTYKYGGGCGHDLSVLRPKGAPIKGTGGGSCGPVGFMNLFSENTNTIAQHGRRGANMQTLRVDHPDIFDFINVKRDLQRVRYSNISVLITHRFMQAVEEDGDFDLTWGGRVYRTVKARELWKAIIESAHASAEPGIIFWDTMKDYHNAEYCSPLVSTNPCGEQPLPDGGACNLGAVNLARFVAEDGSFQWEAFKETVSLGVRFLDDVIDYNKDRHALPIQRENALKDRRVGLGILGLGDMLILRGIKYDSEEALEAVDEVMRVMMETAYQTSINLAVEKGAFPNFKWNGYKNSKFVQNLPTALQDLIRENGIRNATILTVAPTGSGAIVAQTTSGIEPLFATSYFRRVKKNKDFGEEFSQYKVVHPLLKKLFGGDDNLPEYVVTAHEIDPYFRVRMQGVIQKYVDASISSTVNLPRETSPETVADIYMAAYKAGLKGITVYREGSREGILVTKKAAETTTTTTNPSLKPRVRPAATYGITRRIRTGEGSLYITINHDERGLCEIFTTIGKAGGNAAAQAEAISRLISLALRSGIDAREIIKQLKGISGPNPVWENGQLILSTPDAIGKALEAHLKEYPESTPASVFHNLGKDTDREGSKEKDGLTFTSIENGATSKTMVTCPECGATLLHESGCVTCPHCGYSKC